MPVELLQAIPTPSIRIGLNIQRFREFLAFQSQSRESSQALTSSVSWSLLSVK